MKSSTISTAGFLTCLISAVALGVASGQTPTRKPLRTEPLEKYDMPPAYIYRLETGPRMISRYASFTSFQVNVDANGQNILGDAANEPSIAVDPTNGNKMTIGWRQFNSVTPTSGRPAGVTPAMAAHVDVPRRFGKQRFPQRPGVKL